MENNLSYTQKKEIGFIAVRCSIASCDFNTKINCAIKRNSIFKDEVLLLQINKAITSFKEHLIAYLNILDYRVLELCPEMFTIDFLMVDMRNVDCLVNDDLVNFVDLLSSFVEKILNIRNSIYSIGCDKDSCDKTLSKAISLLGVNKKYVR